MLTHQFVIRTLIPLTPAVVPFGLVTGFMAIEMGMSLGMSMEETRLLYSGSAQLVALRLLSAFVGRPWFARPGTDERSWLNCPPPTTTILGS
ncbi:hypothetical protein F6476_13595 [Pseudomonas umsongensis]|nr:hypothetical protein F6476_13595 [Pseudomonas umsongensis]